MATRKKTSRSKPKATSEPAEGRFVVLLEQIQEQNRATIEAVASQNGLLENMQDQNRATIEAVRSLEQKMDRRFEETQRENGIRFESLEAAVRLNSADIRKNSADIVELKSSVDDLARKVDALTRRMERVEELLGMKADAQAMATLEARLRRIEERLGLSSV